MTNLDLQTIHSNIQVTFALFLIIFLLMYIAFGRGSKQSTKTK